MALEVLERYEDAIASFDKAIEFNPNSYKAFNSKGYLLVQLERDEEALESFEQALKIQPNYANAYYNKAICYSLQGQVKLALDNLQQAIKFNPKYRQEAQTDPEFEEIANDKRFRRLVEG